MHSHRCAACGCVWEHDAITSRAGNLRNAHTCPGCGIFIVTVYFGEQKAQFTNHHIARVHNDSDELPFQSPGE